MPEEPQPTGAVEVFYSYSHKDEELRDALEDHLSMLKRQGIISNWHDRGIGAGSEWVGEIDRHLETAHIILLLVSASFLASDYCYDVELKQALERHEAGAARVIPIILKSCDWTGAPFGKLQALPKNGLPVTKWPDRDDALTDVAKGIRKAVEALATARRTSEASAASATEKLEGAGKNIPSLIPRAPVVGFVARRDEQGRDIVARLKGELTPEKNQLVALWGPGGTGKTTLAAEVVRETGDAFQSRVAWVSALGRADFNLATLLDEIATQLGHANLRTLAPEPKAAQVSALVSAHPVLVVLDNFETIAGVEQERCLDFLAQNAACPALVTTRSFINRDDVYNVPLAAMTMDEANDFLQRLVERTRKPSNFDKLDRNDLIRRCEANPLVLQWVVRQIDLAKRPQDVLNDLAQGEGDAAERVFTRSFNLPQVGDDGRAALLALSLFTPHASRESLAEVSGFDNDLRRLDKAIEALSSLWLVETTEGNERLFLRGLTRELAKSRLSKNEHADDFLRRYIAHFLSHAEAHAQRTPEDLDALEVDKDNLLGAIDAAFRIQDWVSVMQIRSALDDFLRLHGYWDESVRSGEQAEAAARAEENEWNAASFAMGVAMVRKNRGENEESRTMYTEALKVFRRLEVEINVATCLIQLGMIAQNQGGIEEARRLYGESLEIFKKLDDKKRLANCLHNLGTLAQEQGEIEDARQFFSESLEIKKGLNDRLAVAYTFGQLGNLAFDQGELVEARRLYNECLEISSKFGDQNSIAIALYRLGKLAQVEGDKKEARRLFNEALRIFEKLGSPVAEGVRQALASIEGKSD